jgi:hypothetical protein
MPVLARNHHFVPQGYLGGFTDTGTRDGQLYVFDLATRKSFRTRPRNVAAEKDFNRVEVEGQPPDFLEKGLGALEGKASAVIREMGQTKQLARDEDLVYVINLICLLVVRNPRGRRSLTRAKQQTAKTIAQMLVSDKKLWDQHLRSAREAGHITGPDVSFERMKEFVDGERYTIEVATEALIHTELKVFDDILKCVGSRCWSLLDAAPDAPDFITCDHPVTLVFKDPGTSGPIGVGLKQTEIVFPLSPRQALRGVFEDPFKPVVVVKPVGVAAMNTRILRHADRQLYSREPEVSVLRNGEVVTYGLRPNPVLQGMPLKRRP